MRIKVSLDGKTTEKKVANKDILEFRQNNRPSIIPDKTKKISRKKKHKETTRSLMDRV